MNPSPSPPPTRPAGSSEPDAGPQRQLLERLQQVLTRQHSLAGQDDIEGVLALTGEVDVLLGQLARLAGDDEQIDRARLARIRHLHSTLTLSLAARKEDLGGKLSHIRNGKGALRAYGGKAGE